MAGEPTHRRQGALLQDDGSVVWRVWAPLAETVSLVTWRGDAPDNGPHPNPLPAGEGTAAENGPHPHPLPAGEGTIVPMTAEGFGYFACRREGVEEGLRYALRLADGRELPDPASRWQPEGVNRPSAVWFPSRYSWGDDQCRGVPREDLAIYELHVGTFTPEGTLEAIIPRLPQLVELGVTAVELMPVAQFSGERNWGYDGVHPYAVQNTYGGPRALQRLIDAAHQADLAVFLDVVYNHFGPEGNYLNLFGPYCTDRYRTPWGKAVNFDGPESDAVRRFVIDNALMWVRDFHVDGLRLDAVHAIYDFSARHILAELEEAVQEEAARQKRIVHVIAESDQNDVRLMRPREQGGYGLDGQWSDDFHHSVHALLTGQHDGYYQDFGRPEQLAKALNDVFVYDGCYSPFRRRRHGSRVGNLDRRRFVVAIQTHDQVGNRARGDRLTTLVPPEAQRLAVGLLMLSPCVPLLFMGEEYGETRPFPFFCSFSDAGLIEAVRRGRREEFAALAFAWGGEIPDPQARETFLAAKLDWQWSSADRAARRRLYADLLAARRRWPALRDEQHTAARVAVVGGDSSRRYCGGPSGDRRLESPPTVLIVQRGDNRALIACANLTSRRLPSPPLDLAGRVLLLSTEARSYGGRRGGEPLDELYPYELLIFGPGQWRP